MNAFIDLHRARCGVEPICSALQVAPSAYRLHAARRRNPVLLPARARRDGQSLPQMQRVYDQNLRVYGADKVWRQLRREGTAVARCTVERLAQAGIEPSVGSTGDSYDNALAETINGLYRAELIHRRGLWKTRQRRQCRPCAVPSVSPTVVRGNPA